MLQQPTVIVPKRPKRPNKNNNNNNNHNGAIRCNRTDKSRKRDERLQHKKKSYGEEEQLEEREHGRDTTVRRFLYVDLEPRRVSDDEYTESLRRHVHIFEYGTHVRVGVVINVNKQPPSYEDVINNNPNLQLLGIDNYVTNTYLASFQDLMTVFPDDGSTSRSAKYVESSLLESISSPFDAVKHVVVASRVQRFPLSGQNEAVLVH